MSDRIDRFKFAVQRIAESTPGFFETKGPGKGNLATNLFVKNLHVIAKTIFGDDLSEKQCIHGAKLCFDFYLEEEATVIEIALSLDKPNSEYEKDLLKCILAKKERLAIKTLLFICKPGGMKANLAPGKKCLADLCKKDFDISVEFYEIVSGGS
jgi:hypothetical protein